MKKLLSILGLCAILLTALILLPVLIIADLGSFVDEIYGDDMYWGGR